MLTCSQMNNGSLLTYYHTAFQQSCYSSPSKHIFAVMYKMFLRKRLGKNVVQLIFNRSRHNRNLISLHNSMEEMIGLVYMLGSRSDFGQPGQLQSSTVVFKNFAMNAWRINLYLKTLLLDLHEESHQPYYLP